MNYIHLRRAFSNRNAIFQGYNGATGTGNDNSTDPVITRDPNDYVLSRVNSQTLMHTLIIAALVLTVIILLPMAFKTIKSNV